MGINEQLKININGVMQYAAIRAERDNAPLLLYLHGGPGDAALPLVTKFNRELEKHFTVVIWEQRGAGKSYYKFGGGEINIAVFLDDLHALVTGLLERFHQKALFLVGHSWGSVLGLKYTKEHPELVRAYVGCGQVVNMKKSSRQAYEFALEHADEKARKRLRGIDCTYSGENWLSDLMFVTKQIIKHGGSLYGRKSFASLVPPFLFSGCYSLPDLIRWLKGGKQSVERLWQELMQVDFEEDTRFGAPVILIEGRNDRQVSSHLAKQYFDTIETPKQFFWFEHSCHFPHWSENDRFNQLLPEILK